MPKPTQLLLASVLTLQAGTSLTVMQAQDCAPPQGTDYSKPVACECLPATMAAWAMKFPADPRDRILSSKVVYRPKAAYPEAAKSAGVYGDVTVQIAVDESGRVVRAHAMSGHRLLWRAAVEAACQARFRQTSVEGKPVKMGGVMTYSFRRPGGKRSR